jgi:hypothetical protein
LTVLEQLGLVACDAGQRAASPVDRLVPLAADDPILVLLDGTVEVN